MAFIPDPIPRFASPLIEVVIEGPIEALRRMVTTQAAAAAATRTSGTVASDRLQVALVPSAIRHPRGSGRDVLATIS
jgi:hypothetical protein